MTFDPKHVPLAAEFNTIFLALDRLITALGFVLVHPNESDPPLQDPASPHFFAPRFVYIGLPTALGILPLDKTYRLICASDMSAERFWEYVGERLDLDRELLTPRSDRLTIDGHQLFQVTQGALAEAKIVLCYARYTPCCFNGRRIFKAWSSPDGWSPASRHAPNLHQAAIYDAQELKASIAALNSGLPHLDARISITFMASFGAMRDWALKSGILSSRFHMLSETALLCLFVLAWETDLGLRSPLIQVDVPKYVLQSPMIKEMRQNILRVVAPSGHILIAQPRVHEEVMTSWVFSKIALGTVDPEQYGELQGLDGFLSDRNVFLKISGVCWEYSHIPQLANLVTRVILDLPEQLRGRIWPFSFTDETRGESTFLVAPNVGKNDRFAQFYLNGLEYDRHAMSVTYQYLNVEQAKRLIEQSRLKDSTPSEMPLRTPITGTANSRFRTAGEIMKRLRWDQAHLGIDYEVGYKDRFQVELMYKGLRKWETFTEEDEFIPEHRIMIIRREQDKVVIWDRAKRLDTT